MKKLMTCGILAAVLLLGACSSISHPSNVGATETEMYGSHPDAFDATRN